MYRSFYIGKLKVIFVIDNIWHKIGVDWHHKEHYYRISFYKFAIILWWRG